MSDAHIDEPDDLDGCELDFAEAAVDDETAELLPLFPGGDPAKAAEWRALFGGTDAQAAEDAEEVDDR